MLAARLCLLWGIPDVEDWFARQPPHILNFWEGFDRVEPIGEAWRQTAQLSSMLSQILGAHYAATGVELEALSQDDCMPARYAAEKKPKPKINPQHAVEDAKRRAKLS